MKINNILRIIITTLFIIFISLYIVGNSSYYDYEASRKKRLTEEQIKKFEEKISKGEKIDYAYYQESEKIYDNIVSKTTLDISNNIGNTVSKSLNYIFKKLEKVMNQ